ncbi:DNA-binding protein WhiA [Ruminococcus sp.]|uniref:DNA-binding protein WhiA n=1 Tax=Ruminococcus sp. TaxID=41978 RepID=UPI00388DDFF9
MSFSSDTKREMCQKLSTRKSLQYSELYAMLLLGKEFTSRSIIFKTENEDTFSHFIFLLDRLFKAKCEVIAPQKGESGRNRTYTVTVLSPEKCRKIFEHYGHEDRDVNLRVNRANIDDEEEQRAFIRGAFLACGSVTNPEKAYHLEFAVSHRNLCMDICRLIHEIQDCQISAKMLSRGGTYIAYLKDSEQITDLLTYMGAVVASMNVMGTKALKQVRNTANRRANSEIANLQKTASAAANQIRAIKKLRKSGKYNLLPEELKTVAQLRYEYPELTLRELGAKLDPPISRSGVNHRLEKIIHLAEEA